MSALLDAVTAMLGPHRAPGPVVVAASGGADSTALALITAALRDAGRLPFDGFVLAHCDHHQHARHLDAVAQVRALGARLACAVATVDLDLPADASEERMRVARYAALREIALDHGSHVVATAHHVDDQIETLVMRARRGTGRRGLAGIPVARALGRGVSVVRPCLEVERDALHAFVAAAGVPFVADPTNADTRRARAAVRHVVLPERRAEPDFTARLLRIARRTAASNQRTAGAARRHFTTHGAQIAPWRVEFTAASALDDTALRELLRQCFVSVRDAAPLGRWLDRAVATVRRGSGAQLGAELDVEVTRDRVVVFSRAAIAAPPAHPLPWDADDVARAFGGTGWTLVGRTVPAVVDPPPPQRTAGRFDPVRAPGPWRLRAPRADDRFAAPGLATAPLLRRVMQARGVPRLDRARLPLLVDATDRVVWAPGLDVAAFARLGATTGTAIEIAVVPHAVRFVAMVPVLPGGIDGAGPSY